MKQFKLTSVTVAPVFYVNFSVLLSSAYQVLEGKNV